MPEIKTLPVAELGPYLEAELPLLSWTVEKGELTLHAAPEDVLKVLRFVRDNPKCAFRQLMDVCGVDYPDRPLRFDVVYHLLSIKHNQRLRVVVSVPESDPSVESTVSIFPAAGWWERETWDLMGIRFKNHPDLRRILTDYGFEGHPLRKDFPVMGFLEVRYDEEVGRIVHEPVQLDQAYRTFDTLSPWEGQSAPKLPGDEKASCTIITPHKSAEGEKDAPFHR